MTKSQWIVIGILATASVIVLCLLFSALFLWLPNSNTSISLIATPIQRSTETPTTQNVIATQTATVPTSTSTLIATSTPQATSTPTCNLEPYETQYRSYIDKFAEAEKRITSIYVVPKSPTVYGAVVEMGNIRRDFGKVQPPQCALTVHELSLDAMDAAIEAAMATFNEGLSPTAVQKWNVSNSKTTQALTELDKLRARVNAQDNRPPTAVPTQPPAPGAKRITFARGGISATVQGTTGAVDADHWVLAAMAGQTMSVNLIVPTGKRATLVIYGADGTVLLSDRASVMQWSGLLPKTQDYFIEVKPETGAMSYTLQVTIPPLK